MEEIPQIFIGSTTPDLHTCRMRVVEAVGRQHCYAASESHFTPDYKILRDVLRKAIEPCDAMVHIVGKLYGFEPKVRPTDIPRRSYSQLEYEIARELGIPIFVFICNTDFPYDKHQPELPDKQQLQEAYRRRLTESDYLYTDVNTPEELEEKVVEALAAFLLSKDSPVRRGGLSTATIAALSALAVVIAGAGALALFKSIGGANDAYQKTLAAAGTNGTGTAGGHGATQPPPMKFEKPPAGWKGPVIGTPWNIPDLDLLLMPIAPGSFKMGSPDDEHGRDPDEKQHQVNISRPFWMGKFEVTQEQWQRLMGTNPSVFNAAGKDAPVEYITWHDAMAFCKKLNDRERAAGRLPAGYSYTLPTDAEWEYAARAGTTGSFGVEKTKFADIGWNWDNSARSTRAAGLKKPNAWGLYDMHGNVSEWCRDWDEVYSTATATDPVGQTTGSHRIVRGGSWQDAERFCRSAFRDWKAPTDRFWTVGFRLALSPVTGD